MKKRFRKIYVEITNVCNLNCKFCPKDNREKTFMPVDKFAEIINKIKEYTDIISLHIKGEPLIHKNLGEFLSICDKNGVMVNLTTNGTLLKEKLDILLGHKSLRQINISVHSITQNANMNNIDYLNNVFAAVSKLQNTCIISYRLWNISKVEEKSENMEILKMLGEQYNLDNLTKLAKENSYVKLKDNVFLNQDFEFEWPNIHKVKNETKGTCLGLKSQLGILSNGDVVPCCLDQNADILLGNIFEEDLENILNLDRSIKIIEGFNQNKLVEDLCKTCGYRKRFDKVKE